MSQRREPLRLKKGHQVAIEQGRVTYEGRAFQQDSEAAMSGDILRALIELITNADDAYRGKPGAVEVVVRPSADVVDDTALASDLPVAVLVHDSARGLSAEGLKKCFSVLGGQNEQFMEGEKVRGLLGRGAKDVAGMGQVRFESIHNGLFSSFLLKNTGDWELLASDRVPTSDEYSRLQIKPGGAGLTATVLVKKAYRVPAQNDLVEKIRDHVQLRALVARRQVILTDKRKGKAPVIIDPLPLSGDDIVSRTLSLGPDYGDVELRLRKLPSKETRPLSDYSRHGIVVSGQSAGYMNTLFGQHGRPESGWIAGDLTCPQIEDLVRSYDDNAQSGKAATSRNPLRLVSRDRDGLVQQHPFFERLTQAVANELLPVLDSLAKREAADHKPGDKLAQALSVAQKALLSPLRQALEEIDEEQPDGPGGGADAIPDLLIVPPRLVLHAGEERTLSVRFAGDAGVPFTAEISVGAPADLIDIVSVSTDFKPHPRLDAVTSTFSVRAGSELGDTQITVTAGSWTAFASVSVIPPSSIPETPVTDLSFERETYRVAPEKARNLRLIAPVDWAGESIHVVHLGGPAVLTKDEFVLKAGEDGRCSECTVRVQAGKDLGKASIQAKGPADSVAETSVQIEERPPSRGLELDLQLLDQDSKILRASSHLLDGKLTVRVYGRQAALKGVLGPYDEAAGRFSKEDDPAARAVLAEVVGLELASFLVEREAYRRPELEWDPPRVISKQQERASRLITVAQKALEERAGDA